MSKNESLSASSLKESLKKERLSDEITQLKAAIDSVPNDVESRVKLAVVLTEQGESDLAIAYLEDAIRINPNYADAYYQLGFILCQEKDELEVAIVQFRKAISLNQNDGSYHALLACCLEEQGKFTEAVIEYQEAIRLKPDDVGACIQLGKILRDLEQKEKAKAIFQKAKDLLKLQNHKQGIKLVDMFLSQL